MSFTQHAFISYAHLDDRPLSDKQKGWVTRFHATFEALLSMRLGEKARVWRDDKLRGNDVFAPEIVAQFPQTALLITIVTPRYVQSEWCRRELDTFCEEAQRAGGLTVANHSRVLNVVKSPIDDRRALPPVMQETLGYTFFAVEDGVPIELDGAYGEQFASDYNRRVCKLAWDAAQVLKQLRAVESSKPTPTTLATRTVAAAIAAPEPLGVFVALTGADLAAERERLVAELQQQGVQVAPVGAIALDDADACMAQWRADLQSADLAVQLIGAKPGPTPDGAAEPLIALQHRLLADTRASKRVGEPFARIIWLPERLASAVAGHQGWIEALRRDATLQAGADMVYGGYADLSSRVHDTLSALSARRNALQALAQRAAQSASAAASTDAAEATGQSDPATRAPGAEAKPAPTSLGGAVSGAPLVYLIGTEADRRSSIPLRKALKEQGWDVAWPAVEGDASSVRLAHEQQLQTCDALVIFYGAGNDAWKRSVDADTRKILALIGRRVPTWTVVAAPLSADKQDVLDMDETNTLRWDPEHPGPSSNAVLDRLRAALRTPLDRGSEPMQASNAQ
jgi:hypothetical protein